MGGSGWAEDDLDSRPGWEKRSAHAGLMCFLLPAVFIFPFFAVESGTVGARPIAGLQLGAKKDRKLLGILRTPSSDPVLLVSTLSSSLNLNPVPSRAHSAALFSSFRNATQGQLCHTFTPVGGKKGGHRFFCFFYFLSFIIYTATLLPSLI